MIRGCVYAVVPVLALTACIVAILHAQEGATRPTVLQDKQDVTVPSHGLADGGIVILDDCDPEFTGKDTFEDNLTYFDSSGELVFRVTGFNNCATIGTNHKIVTDADRGFIWAVDYLSRKVRKFDVTGRELFVVRDIKVRAVAVDPETGNLWALATEGSISTGATLVFDAEGRYLATYNVIGYDIAYDRQSKSFWIAGQALTKINAENGRIVFRKRITAFCSSCIAVHQASGQVWVTTRRHPEVPSSKRELLGFKNDGTQLHVVALGDKDPSNVSVNSENGDVYVTIARTSVQRYSAEAELEAEFKFEALAAQVAPRSNDVWIVTPQEIVRVNAKGDLLEALPHKSKTSHAWIMVF